MQGQESVPSVLESEARGEIADIYADIRKVLGTSVVNLIWRNLATMPGALEWTWSTVRPLYLGDAPLHAEAVRQTIALPDWSGFSTETLLAAGVDETERALIRDVLDSYRYTYASEPSPIRSGFSINHEFHGVTSACLLPMHAGCGWPATCDFLRPLSFLREPVSMTLG